MAKRAPVDEKPYRPLLDPGVVSAAIGKAVAPQQHPARDQRAVRQNVVEITRSETQRTDVVAEAERHDTVAEAGRAAQPRQPLVEKFDHEKRILFTRPESQAIDRLVTSLAGRLNAQVKVSHVMRALVALLLNAEAEVDRRAGESGPLFRPPNGDAKALQRFEHEIARIIGVAFRDAGPVK